MDRFPDEDWRDGFGFETIDMSNAIAPLTDRQKEIFNLLLDKKSKIEIEASLSITRWTLNRSIRAIKKAIYEELSN